MPQIDIYEPICQSVDAAVQLGTLQAPSHPVELCQCWRDVIHILFHVLILLHRFDILPDTAIDPLIAPGGESECRPKRLDSVKADQDERILPSYQRNRIFQLISKGHR